VSRTLCLLLALPAVLGALACPELCMPRVDVPGQLYTWAEPGTVDVPHAVMLSPTLTRMCNASDAVPDTVAVSVTDPTGQPIEATAVLQGDLTARVEFTPRLPGMHRVAVTFEPRGGRDQLDVMIALDRRVEPGWALPPDCIDHVALSPDAVVCGDQLYRDGVAVGDPLGVEGPWISGGRHLWSLSDSRVIVFRDDGSGALVHVATDTALTLPASESWSCSAASGRRAFVTTSEDELWFLEVGEDGTFLPPTPIRNAGFGHRVKQCVFAGDQPIILRVIDREAGLVQEVVRWPFGAPESEGKVTVVEGDLQELNATYFLTSRLVGFTMPRAANRLSLTSFLPDDPLGSRAFADLPTQIELKWPLGADSNTGGSVNNDAWVIHRTANGLGVSHFGSIHSQRGPGFAQVTEHHVLIPETDGVRMWRRQP
jgi:hypothetical protein